MITLALLVAAYIGMICHWYKKVYRKQTTSGLIEYIKTHPQHTFGALAAVTGAVCSLIATGVELSEQTVAVAFSFGFSLDSAINKAPEEV